jgi:uncharacterized protein (DUF4415 family)
MAFPSRKLEPSVKGGPQRRAELPESTEVREHYDFSNLKARRNPYPKLLKQPITIRLDRDTIDYFRALAAKTGLPYQNLINLYLRDCAAHRRELSMEWIDAGLRSTTKPDAANSGRRASGGAGGVSESKTSGRRRAPRR